MILYTYTCTYIDDCEYMRARTHIHTHVLRQFLAHAVSYQLGALEKSRGFEQNAGELRQNKRPSSPAFLKCHKAPNASRRRDARHRSPAYLKCRKRGVVSQSPLKITHTLSREQPRPTELDRTRLLKGASTMTNARGQCDRSNSFGVVAHSLQGKTRDIISRSYKRLA